MSERHKAKKMYSNFNQPTCTVTSQHDDSKLDKTDEEPLFVEDRTNTFKLNRTIQYESTPVYKSNSQRFERQNACWNCTSVEHALHNCPEPRNHRMISQNRNTFHMQKQQQQQQYTIGRNLRNNRFSGHKNSRYFLTNNKSYYSDFTPGKLSDELLKALDVPENGIPLHVYKMREYGYPRGWLEEAKEAFSGISIFTAPDKCLPLPGIEKAEDNIFHCKINVNKLHKYPGFNAPPPSDSVDEYKKYGCPEFSPDQSLKRMYDQLNYKTLNTNLTAKKNNINTKKEFSSNINDNLIEKEDMCTIVLKEKNSRPSSPEDGEITDDDDDDMNDQYNIKEPATEMIIDDKNKSEKCEDTNDSVNDIKLSLSNTINSKNEVLSTPSGIKRKFGDIKSEVLGTPVLKHFSTYENRPTHEHFAKGMVDMVEHENLPNSVGTFSKLKEILKDVRKTLNNLLD